MYTKWDVCNKSTLYQRQNLYTENIYAKLYQNPSMSVTQLIGKKITCTTKLADKQLCEISMNSQGVLEMKRWLG